MALPEARSGGGRASALANTAPGVRHDLGGMIASAFLRSECTSAQAAVSAIVHATAAACNADVDFYSVPGGRGRETKVRGCCSLQPNDADFIVVCSSEDGMNPGDVLHDTTDRLEIDALRQALRGLTVSESRKDSTMSDAAGASPLAAASSAAAVKHCVAVGVQTAAGLEGALLIRARGDEEEQLLQPGANIILPRSETSSSHVLINLNVSATELQMAARQLKDECSNLHLGLPSRTVLEGDRRQRSRSLSPLPASAKDRARELKSRVDYLSNEYMKFMGLLTDGLSGGTTRTDLLPAAQTASLLLAERLERIQWRKEASTAVAAVRGMLHTMSVVANASHGVGGLERSVDAARFQVPREVTHGDIGLARYRYWTFNPRADEMVLHKQRPYSQTIVPAKMCHAGLCAHEAVPCLQELQGGGAEPAAAAAGPAGEAQEWESSAASVAAHACTLCVPLRLEREPWEDDAGEGFRTVVLEFIPEEGEKDSIDHYTLVAAEALRTSILPMALRLRVRMVRMLEARQQMEGLKNLTSRLNASTGLAEVVAIVEAHLMKVMSCEECTFYFVDLEQGKIWAPPTDEVPNGVWMAIGEGLPGSVLQEVLEGEHGEDDDGIRLCNDLMEISITPAPADSGSPVARNALFAPVWKPGRGTEGNESQGPILALIALVNKRPTGQRLTGMGSTTSRDSEEFSGEAASFCPRDHEIIRGLAFEIAHHINLLLPEALMVQAQMERLGDHASSQQVAGIYRDYYTKPPDLLGALHREESIDTALSPSEPPRLHTQTRTSFLTVGGAGAGRTTVGGAGAGRTGSSQQAHRQDSMQSEAAIAVIQQEFSDGPAYNVHCAFINYWALTEDEEFRLTAKALRELDVFAHLALPPKELFNYVSGIKAKYNNNAYHSFSHAISTVHYAFKLVHDSGTIALLSPTERCALILGALAHDVGHRGYNNVFEIRTRSALALRYSDKSVLEMHSSALAFEVAFGQDKCNVFKDLSSELFGTLRSTMVAAILSTDMQFHGDQVKRMHEITNSSNIPSGEMWQNRTQFLVEVMLHMADIVNPAMPTANSVQWSALLAKEATLQVEEEERLGIPITGYMQGLGDPKIAAKSQLNFMDFMVRPLLVVVHMSFPGIEEIKKQFEKNRQTVSSILDPSLTQLPVLGHTAARRRASTRATIRVQGGSFT